MCICMGWWEGVGELEQYINSTTRITIPRGTGQPKMSQKRATPPSLETSVADPF